MVVLVVVRTDLLRSQMWCRVSCRCGALPPFPHLPVKVRQISFSFFSSPSAQVEEEEEMGEDEERWEWDGRERRGRRRKKDELASDSEYHYYAVDFCIGLWYNSLLSIQLASELKPQLLILSSELSSCYYHNGAPAFQSFSQKKNEMGGIIKEK